ncbi:hypothetical protein EJB05_11925 [Eragrostis curvula]|uniref:Uncharacterized protein n=1 Tax=Eragrostis curvula TaxID=38414 RepID=A0A5J9VE90_9POAL|nr:hypothetical protein EJB05_24978 [Eragrostis curvula]TVU38548.1 hypothetical protein EJB05_11925 [Eragrostis curvula]
MRGRLLPAAREATHEDDCSLQRARGTRGRLLQRAIDGCGRMSFGMHPEARRRSRGMQTLLRDIRTKIEVANVLYSKIWHIDVGLVDIKSLFCVAFLVSAKNVTVSGYVKL